MTRGQIIKEDLTEVELAIYEEAYEKYEGGWGAGLSWDNDKSAYLVDETVQSGWEEEFQGVSRGEDGRLWVDGDVYAEGRQDYIREKIEESKRGQVIY